MHDSYADRGRESAVVKKFDLSSGDAVERWVPPMSGAQMLALGVKDESKLYLATASLKWHVSFVPTCAVDPACHSQVPDIQIHLSSTLSPHTWLPWPSIAGGQQHRPSRLPTVAQPGDGLSDSWVVVELDLP